MLKAVPDAKAILFWTESPWIEKNLCSLQITSAQQFVYAIAVDSSYLGAFVQEVEYPSGICIGRDGVVSSLATTNGKCLFTNLSMNLNKKISTLIKSKSIFNH